VPTVVSAGISRDMRSASWCVGAEMVKVIRLLRVLVELSEDGFLRRGEGVEHTFCKGTCIAECMNLA
jgi:hypothetical protein